MLGVRYYPYYRFVDYFDIKKYIASYRIVTRRRKTEELKFVAVENN